MTMTTAAPVKPRKRSTKPSPDDAQHFTLDGVSWAFYEALLREFEEGHARITFDEGRLEFMSPLREHEKAKHLIGRFIGAISFALNIPVDGSGSMTMRRKDLQKGIEPDECFYIQNERRVRGRKRLDFRRDPLPDLAIEVDVTHGSINRLPIYAALGVPEVWRFDGRRILPLQLGPDGEYHPIEKSLAFPFLRPADLKRFIGMASKSGDMAAVRAFHDWVIGQHGKAP